MPGDIASLCCYALLSADRAPGHAGYFCLSTYTRALGFMRMPITLLQLAQMITGLFLVTRAWWYQRHGGGCAAAYGQGYFRTMYLMYGSYFLLFAHFFYQAYVAKTERRRNAAAAAVTKSKKAS